MAPSSKQARKQAKQETKLWQALEARVAELEQKLQGIGGLGQNDLLTLPAPNTDQVDGNQAEEIRPSATDMASTPPPHFEEELEAQKAIAKKDKQCYPGGHGGNRPLTRASTEERSRTTTRA